MAGGIFDLGASSSRSPITAKLGKTTFWAERGLVHFEIDGDLKEGEHRYDSMRLSDALQKLIIVCHVTKQLQGMPVKNPASIREHKKFCNDMREVCYLARRQGSPFNPDVVKESVRQQRRRSVSVIDPNTKTVNPDGSFDPSSVMKSRPSRNI